VLESLAARIEGAVGWAVRNPVAVIGVAGVVVFGLLRLVYYVFYRHLGVTPEDAGFGYSDTLIDASLVALGLAVAGVLALAGLSILAVVLILSMGVGAALVVAGVVALVLVAFVVPVFLLGGLVVWLPSVSAPLVETGFSIFDSLVSSAGDWLAWSLAAIRRYLLWLMGSERRPLRTVTLTGAVVLTVVGLGVCLTIRADRAGTAAARGTPTDGVHLLGIPLLDVRAESATVSWVGGSSKPGAFTSCLVYLGRAESVAVFYDVPGKHPLRLPSGNVTFSKAPCAYPWLNSFRTVKLQKRRIAYRVYGGGSNREGFWATPTAPATSDAARKRLALPPINSAHCLVTVQIAAGTTIRVGHVGPAFDEPGGAGQIEIVKPRSGVRYLDDASLPPADGPCP
jgi:hypothetical protein